MINLIFNQKKEIFRLNLNKNEKFKVFHKSNWKSHKFLNSLFFLISNCDKYSSILYLFLFKIASFLNYYILCEF